MGAVTAAVVGGAIMAGGSYMAAREQRQGAQAAVDAANASAKAFQGIPIPTVEEQQIILQNPDLMGQYSPEQQQAMHLNVSAMQEAGADPETIAAQNQALKQISEVAQGGFTEGDKAAAREVNRDVNSQAQARQKAILNAMASRGVLGSGMELAAQLQGNQQSMDQASKAGDNLIQQAQARALQAIGQQGTLAGQMRGQQYGESADKARAADEINRFNVQNQQAVNNQNVASRNQAQVYNLQQRQAMEDQRAANANQQQMHNKALIQTHYANQRGQAQDIAGANAQVAAAQQNSANARAGQIAGITQGIGTAVGGIGSYYNNQANNQNALELARIKAGQGT